jgi:hypothetical protein
MSGSFSKTLAGIGHAMAHVPVWEIVVVLILAAAVLALAFKGHPRRYTMPEPQSDEAAKALIHEIQGVDRGLSVHANGVLTLSVVAAGAFGTVLEINGGPGMALNFATTIALLTGITIATQGFAIEGGPTGAESLPSDELHACARRELQRARRRLQCVRVGTWCLFPIVLLVVISIAAVRH